MGKNKRKASSTRVDSGKPRTSVAEVSNRHEKDYVKKQDEISDTHHHEGIKMNSWRNNSCPVKYHGLLNQGATCYLNSVLQVLFMTEDFRAAVERHTFENPDHDCIDRHLKTLFADLKEQTAHTYKITQKLGINRVHEQQDAAEYFEKILRLIRSGASQIFHGQLTHKTICTTCSAVTDRDGAFWHLPLALVDSNSEYRVVDGIEDYFRPSEFSGENQIYCNKCHAKSDATIKRVIKHHPEVLMLLLKRFEFNYSYSTYVKINCTVEVPFTLQIPENQTYELYAVVDHFGSLISGHYTATIKDDEGWYTFNDSRVTLLGHQLFQNDFEKSSSAYLLFYRKMNVPAADTQDNKEVSTPGKKRKRETEGAEVGLPPDLCNDEQPGRKEKSLTKYPVEYRYNEDNAREHLGGTQEVGQDDDDKPVSVQMEVKTGEGERSSEGEKLFEFQDNRREGDSEENMPEEDQTCEQGSSTMYNIHEQQREDKIYVKEHKDGDDKHGQSERKGKSLIKYSDRDVEYQDNEVSARQNINEDLGGTQEAGQDDDVKPVSVQMEIKAEEGERSSEGEKLLDLQDNRRDGDSEENMPKAGQDTKEIKGAHEKKKEKRKKTKKTTKEQEQKEQGDKVTTERKTGEGDKEDTREIRGARENQDKKKKKKGGEKNKKNMWVSSLVKRIRDFRFRLSQMNMVNIFPLVFLLKEVRVSFGIVVFFSLFGLVSSLL